MSELAINADGQVKVRGGEWDSGEEPARIVLLPSNELWEDQLFSIEFRDGRSLDGSWTFSGGNGTALVLFGSDKLRLQMDAESGVAIWTINVKEQFDAKRPEWGFCGSPMVIDESIYMQAGQHAAVVAINLFSGETKWNVSGNRVAYASLIALMKNKLLVGVDEKGYFACQRTDGKLVRSHRPRYSGDFGVPSPVLAGDWVVFTSENNGLMRFANLVDIKGPAGRILDQCRLTEERVRILSHPAVSNGRLLLRVGEELRCYKMSHSSDDQASTVSTSGATNKRQTRIEKEWAYRRQNRIMTTTNMPGYVVIWHTVDRKIRSRSLPILPGFIRTLFRPTMPIASLPRYNTIGIVRKVPIR